MRRVRQLIGIGLVALLGALASPAEAQSTGSSFGGGSFGGGSSSSWGGGSSSSWSGGSSSWGGSSSGWSSGSSSYSSGSYSSSGGSADPVFVIIVIVFLVGSVVIKGMARNIGRRALGTAGPSTYGATPSFVANVDVTSLMIAIDARARSRLQRKLDEMARTGNTSTPAGRRQLLAAAIAAIEAERASWAYVGSRDARPAPPAQAERTFTQMTGDLRSRFRHELVRNVEGDVDQRDAPEMKARADEGEGLCVVSFVVAAKRTLADLGGIADPNRFRQALRVLRSLSVPELVAFEVIWSPAESNDRMSSAELEVLYSEMHPIAAEPMGRVACGHCGATYARELGQCPSCGAPPPAA